MAGSVKLLTPSGGSVTINATDTVSALSLTLPATNDNIITANTTQTLTNKTLTSPTISSPQITTGATINHTGSVDTGALLIGDITTPASNTSLYLRSTTKCSINFSAGGVLAFNGAGDGSSERMRIDSSGNIGIGTTAPTAGVRLNISDAKAKIQVTSTTGTNAGYMTFSNTGGNVYFGIDNSAGTDFSAAYAGVMWQGGACPLVFATSNAERMRLDASGNLGIGTSSPYALLNPNTSSRNSTALWLSAPLYNNGGLSVDSYVEMKLGNSYIGLNSIGQSAIRSYANVWSNSASDLTFHTSTSAGTLTERMRLDSSGNLGLGVTPSAWFTSGKAVQVGAGASLTGTTTASQMLLGANYYFNGTNNIYIASQQASYYQQLSGVHSWYTAASGTAGNAISFTQAMTLDASGNLGVGETSPSSYGKLTVTDQAVPNGGTYLAVRGGYPGYAGAYGYGLKIYDKDNTTPYFIVGSDYTFTINKFTSSGTYTTALKLDAAGNLLVGSTSAISGFNNQVSSTGSSTNRGCLIVGRTTAATSGVCGSLIAFNGSNAVCGFDLQSNGANNSGFIQSYTYNAGAYAQGPYVNTGGTSWTTASDERLKDISGVIEGALEKTASLRAIEYTLKSDPSKIERVGLVAQDVQKVLPQAVSEDSEGYLGVQYTDTIPLLVAAIQELSAQNKALEDRLAKLEAK